MKKLTKSFGIAFVLFTVLFALSSCEDSDDGSSLTSNYSGDTVITLTTPNLTAELTDDSYVQLNWDYITGVNSWRLARFIDSEEDDRGVLLSTSYSTSSSDYSFYEDGKGYTYIDKSSLTDGIAYRYELTALTSNGYTEARTLYLKNSETATVTITYGNLAHAANLTNSSYPVTVSLNGTAKASVRFYPRANVEYRAILVDSVSVEAIATLMRGDTTGTTLKSYETTELETYDGTEEDTFTITGEYKPDTTYYLVFLARFADTASFGESWSYLGQPYGSPTAELTTNEIISDANLTSADFEIAGTAKAKFKFYPLAGVKYRVGVAAYDTEEDSAYVLLNDDDITDSDIERLTTLWSKTSITDYDGDNSDIITISDDYEIGTTYRAFVFVNLSGADDDYSSSWIRIGESYQPYYSSTYSYRAYFASDSLTMAEVTSDASLTDASFEIAGTAKAKATLYPITGIEYRIGVAPYASVNTSASASEEEEVPTYVLLSADEVADSDIESLTAWEASSTTSTYTGSTSQTVSISGSYDIGMNYYAFVFVKLSGYNSDYGTEWIRITSGSNPYMTYDSLTATEVGTYALRTSTYSYGPSLTITNKNVAEVKIYPLSTVSYQVAIVSSSSAIPNDDDYEDIVVSESATSYTAVTTNVSGTYVVNSASTYSYNYYYAKFRVKFIDDENYGTTEADEEEGDEGWIEVETSSSIRDYLSTKEYLTNTLTSDYVVLSVDSATSATVSFPVDSTATYRYQIVATDDTTTINTIKGATNSSSAFTSAVAVTEELSSKEDFSNGRIVLTVEGEYDAEKTYKLIVFAYDSYYATYTYLRYSNTVLGESEEKAVLTENTAFNGTSYALTSLTVDGVDATESMPDTTISFTDNITCSIIDIILIETDGKSYTESETEAALYSVDSDANTVSVKTYDGNVMVFTITGNTLTTTVEDDSETWSLTFTKQ